MSEQCPQCNSPDGVVRVAESGLPELAPPPPPPVPGKAGKAGKRLRPWAVVVLVVLACLAVLGARSALTEDLSGADAAYRLGYRLGWTVFLLPAPLVWLLGRRTAPEPVGHRHAHTVWGLRMWVWEHARHCRSCRVAFWSPGVLGEGFPGTPGIPLHEFPLTVGALAERADGNTYAKHS
ncbi:hypothetical protein [Kitasatospora cinereorecta]|uniref:Uncharacterized protein n=1 Tax=Kitasatospora cinereorecta TaxID=285560 RepID=A0ABW0VHT6_9ACTN